MHLREQSRLDTSTGEMSALLPLEKFELRSLVYLLVLHFFLVLLLLFNLPLLLVLPFRQHADFELFFVFSEDFRIVIFVELFGGIFSSYASQD